MILGATVVILVFLAFVWISHNRDIVKKFKKKYPTIFVMSIMLCSYFVISLCGGVMVFVFGISLPLLCKFPTLSSFSTILFQCVYWKKKKLEQISVST